MLHAWVWLHQTTNLHSGNTASPRNHTLMLSKLMVCAVAWLAWLNRSANSSAGTNCCMAVLPDPFSIFPKGVWARYYLHTCGRKADSVAMPRLKQRLPSDVFSFQKDLRSHVRASNFKNIFWGSMLPDPPSLILSIRLQVSVQKKILLPSGLSVICSES